VRKQLAALGPDDIHEGADLSVLRRVVRKRLKGLSDDDARVALRNDANELARWLSTAGLPDTRLYFILPILPDAIEVLLTEQPQSPPQSGEASMKLPDGAKVTIENGCWSVKWRRFHLYLSPSHREDMHSFAGRFRDDAKSRPMVDGSGMSVAEVRFGEVAGIKCISKMTSPKFKRADYVLDVPGGHMVATLDSSRGDFDESEFEQYFNTLRVLNYPSPLRADIIIADSMTEFAGQQGSNNWYYGYWQKTGDADGTYNQTEFVPFTQFGVYTIVGGVAWNTSSSSYWTGLAAIGGHPNGVQTSGGRMPVEQWAIRRWISPVDASITITGRLAKFNSSSNGDGILGAVVVDGTEVFSRQISATDGVGVNYSVTATVFPGSIIDLIITPSSASSDANDGTRLTATIILNETEPGPILISPVEKLSSASILVAITNRPSKLFVIQTSSNLTSWVSLLTNAASVPVVRYVEPNIFSSPRRFYRVEVRDP